jgi:hypothetical protein
LQNKHPIIHKNSPKLLIWQPIFIDLQMAVEIIIGSFIVRKNGKDNPQQA